MLKLRYEGTRGYLAAQMLLIDPTVVRAWQHTRSIRMQLQYHQSGALYILAKQYGPDAKILNIGTAWGYSTAILAEAARRATIVSLEPMLGRVVSARAHLAKYKNVRVVRARSWDYLAKHPKSRWDMVFLDGCHRAIHRDIPWFDRLDAGGLFVSHDYVPWKFPQVVAEMDELRGERQFDVQLIDNKQRGMVGLYKNG